MLVYALVFPAHFSGWHQKYCRVSSQNLAELYDPLPSRYFSQRQSHPLLHNPPSRQADMTSPGRVIQYRQNPFQTLSVRRKQFMSF